VLSEGSGIGWRGSRQDHYGRKDTKPGPCAVVNRDADGGERPLSASPGRRARARMAEGLALSLVMNHLIASSILIACAE